MRGPLSSAQLTGAEWAEALLANDNVLRSLCLAEFGAADKDRSGALDREEAWQCIVNICTRFKLESLPRADRCEELYKACDKNADGTLVCGAVWSAASRAAPRSNAACVAGAEPAKSSTACSLASNAEAGAGSSDFLSSSNKRPRPRAGCC